MAAGLEATQASVARVALLAMEQRRVPVDRGEPLVKLAREDRRELEVGEARAATLATPG